MKALEERTGRSLSILYRWIKALEDGRGIRDENKAALIAATAGDENAIAWDDFRPDRLKAAV